MTFDVNNHHSNPHIDALPGKVGTQMIYDGLAAGLGHLAARAGDSGMWKLIGAFRAQLRIIYRLETKNFEKWLRFKLRRDAHFRARVLGDLGGEQALRGWERRARMADTPREPGSSAAGHTAPSSQTQNRGRASLKPDVEIQGLKTTGPKTDNLGLFRLAPIKSREAALRSSVRAANCRPSGGVRGPWTPPQTFRPLAVTPRDLRGYGAALLGDNTALGRDEPLPHELWLSLLAPIMDAAERLTDIETTLAETDGGLVDNRPCIDHFAGHGAQVNRPHRSALCPT